MIKKYVKRLRRCFIRFKEKKAGRYLKYISIPEKNSVDDKKKLVFVLNEAFYGGVPVLSINMVKYYISAGYSVDIVLLRGGALLKNFSELAPVQVCYSHRQLTDTLKILKEIGFNYAICNGIASSRAVKELDTLGFTFVSLIHELPGVIKQLDINKYAKEMTKLSKAVVFPSRFGRQCYEREICNCEAPVFIKHQGLYAVSASSGTKLECKVLVGKRFQFDTEKRLVINVATANERKGFDIFVMMAQLDQETVYLWIGDGFDSKFGNKVKEYMGGCFPNNLILPGYIDDPSLMANIYAGADCLALTSREEPFGSVVLEAFSHRTPVVAFNNRGGYIDVIQPGRTGELVDNIDANAMIAAINALCADPIKYSNIQSACQKTAQESNFETYCDYIVHLLMG